MEYGLLGKNVKNSYSKIIHEKFGLYKYGLLSVSTAEFENILKLKKFKGLNITMPYKKLVLPFCDTLDKIAKNSRSVNTILLKNSGEICGYNTDYFGMKYMAEKNDISFKNKKILILGSGGTCLTAKTLLKDMNAKEILVVSSKGNLNYRNIYEHKNADIIINTTPVGMYPKNNESLVDISKFSNLSGVLDVIYNPFFTNLILQAKKQKIPYAGGLSMLVMQAKMSAQIFKNVTLPDVLVEEIVKYLVLKLANIVLIGMPGSGKTSIGKELSLISGKKFLDTDLEIEKSKSMKIEKIFEKYGEKEFRKFEKDIIQKYGKLNPLVLSTGGGAVLDEKNYNFLKQNSRIYFIERNLNLLETKNRPLSKNLEKMYEFRKHLYENFCDKKVKNDKCIKEVSEKILEDFYKNACY